MLEEFNLSELPVRQTSAGMEGQMGFEVKDGESDSRLGRWVRVAGKGGQLCLGVGVLAALTFAGRNDEPGAEYNATVVVQGDYGSVTGTHLGDGMGGGMHGVEPSSGEDEDDKKGGMSHSPQIYLSKGTSKEEVEEALHGNQYQERFLANIRSEKEAEDIIAEGKRRGVKVTVRQIQPSEAEAGKREEKERYGHNTLIKDYPYGSTPEPAGSEKR